MTNSKGEPIVVFGQEDVQRSCIFESYVFDDLDLLIMQYPKALEPAPLICKIVAVFALLVAMPAFVLSFMFEEIGIFFIAILLLFISYAMLFSPFALAANVVKKGYLFLLNNCFNEAVCFFEKAFAFHIYNFLNKEV